MVLEEQIYTYDPREDRSKSSGDPFTFSHRVFMVMNHRAILVKKTEPKTDETRLTTEVYRQRINQKAKKYFTSYRIPLFFKWILLNPKAFLKKIDEDIKWWSKNDKITDDQFDQDGRRILTILALSRFLCVENAQYFARASQSERAEKLYSEFGDIFEDRALEVLKTWKTRLSSTPSRILENLCLHQLKKSTLEDTSTREYNAKNEYMWNKPELKIRNFDFFDRITI